MDSILSLLIERDKKFAVTQEFDAIKISTKYLDLKRDINFLELSKSEFETKFNSLQSNGQLTPSSMDISDLNAQLVDLYRTKDNLQNENKKIQKHIEDLREEKLKAIAESEDLKKNQKGMDEELLQLGQNRSNVEQKIDTISREISAISEQYQLMQIQTNQLKEALEIYQTKIQESAQFIQEAEKSSPHCPMQKFLTKINAHSSGINAIAFGPGYESVVTVGEDKKLIQWSLPKLTEMLNISTKSICNSIRYQPQSNYMCLSCQDKAIRILDMSTGRFISELTNHTDQCTDSYWISKNQLLSASKDRTVKLFDLTKNAVSSTIMAISAVYGICGTNQPTVFAAACFDGHIRLIDTRMKNVAQKIEKVHSRPICSICSSINGYSLYSLGLDGCVCETSLQNMTRIRQMSDPHLEVKSPTTNMAISIDGGYVCAPSNKGCVCLFDLLSDSPPIINKTGNSSVNCAAYAGNMLVTGDKDHTMSFWV